MGEGGWLYNSEGGGLRNGCVCVCVLVHTTGPCLHTLPSVVWVTVIKLSSPPLAYLDFINMLFS